MRNRLVLGTLRTLAIVGVCFALSGAAQAELIPVAVSGDPIVGIYDTTAGGSSTESSAGTGTGQYPEGELPAKAIDGNTDSKYLNFGSDSPGPRGVNTGFYVTPSMGSTIVNGVQFATANDAAERDPLSFTLEGSSAISGLDQGSNWTLIYSGGTGLAGVGSIKTFGSEQDFANTTAYTSYRLLITEVRGPNANSTQYSEVKLMGQAVPEPSSLILLGIGGLGLVACLWRRR